MAMKRFLCPFGSYENEFNLLERIALIFFEW